MGCNQTRGEGGTLGRNAKIVTVKQNVFYVSVGTSIGMPFLDVLIKYHRHWTYRAGSCSDGFLLWMLYSITRGTP